MRNRKADEARLGLGSDAGRTLIANLTAGARRCTWERRNRGRVIVRLDLHQNVDGFDIRTINAGRGIDEPTTASGCALDDGGVIAIRAQNTLRRFRVRVANHREQRLTSRLAIDDPIRVEDLVATMLRVRLREHHELHVGGFASELGERLEQIIDFVVREREPELSIRRHQSMAITAQRHADKWARRFGHEQHVRLREISKYRLGHPIVDRGDHDLAFGIAQGTLASETKLDAALDPSHGRETADVRNISRLTRPRRDRAGAWEHPQRLDVPGVICRSNTLGTRPVGQQRFEATRILSR